MAKLGAKDDQEDNSVTSTKMKSIKSLFRTPQQNDSYHQLSRAEQVVIFRLRTGHNRLNQHLHRKLRVVPSPMCPCGEAEQDTAHILQDCWGLQLLREETWPRPTTLEEKFYGLVGELQKTTIFILRTGLKDTGYRIVYWPSFTIKLGNCPSDSLYIQRIKQFHHDYKP